MNRIAATALAVLMTSAPLGALRAADFNDPYGSSYSAAPSLPAINWQGPYIGAFAGYGWGSGGGANGNGFLGGVTVGHNWQSNQVVFGVEGDIAYTGISSSTGIGRYDVDWLGTGRARLGYAFDNFMVFGTGGFAWSSSRYQVGAVRDRNTHFGWALGFGAEAAITSNLNAKLDFIHTNFSSENYRIGGAGTSLSPTTNAVRAGLNHKF